MIYSYIIRSLAWTGNLEHTDKKNYNTPKHSINFKSNQGWRQVAKRAFKILSVVVSLAVLIFFFLFTLNLTSTSARFSCTPLQSCKPKKDTKRMLKWSDRKRMAFGSKSFSHSFAIILPYLSHSYVIHPFAIRLTCFCHPFVIF